MDLPIPPALRELQDRCSIRLEHLPVKIARLGAQSFNPSQPNGLLYLEHPYVVPGGQFNEMYGWDSYFIIRGLLRENRIDLAKGMVENFFFEIENYGGVLNANRTYYLTRSQPPFLSSMVLAVYEAQTKHGQPDLHWLERAYGSWFGITNNGISRPTLPEKPGFRATLTWVKARSRKSWAIQVITIVVLQTFS